MSATPRKPAELDVAGDGAPAESARSDRGESISRGDTIRSILSNWFFLLFVIASGFILPRLIDRFRGQALLGVWDLGWTLSSLVDLAATAMASAITPYVARARAREDWALLNRSLTASVVVLLLGFFGGLLGTWGFSASLRAALPEAPPEVLNAGYAVIWLLGASASVRCLFNAHHGVLTGYSRYDLLNRIRVTRQVLTIILMTGLLILGFEIWTLALCDLLLEIGAGLAKIGAARRLCPTLSISPRHWSGAEAGTLFRFGLQTLVQSAARGGLYHINSLLISRYLGSAQLAVYSRQRSLVIQLQQFVKQYSQVFISLSSDAFERRDFEALRRHLVSSVRLAMFMALPACVMLMVVGDAVVGLWMGERYIAQPVLIALAAGHVFSISQFPAFSILTGMGRHGGPAAAEAAAAILSVASGYICLSWLKLGILSAAISVAAPLALFTGIALPWFACRAVGIGYWEYWAQVLSGPLLAAAPIVGSALAANLIRPHDVTIRLVATLLVGGAAWAVLLWTRGLPSSVREAITAKLTRRIGGASRMDRRPGAKLDPRNGAPGVAP